MTTEVWRVHILWIFQITKITRAKSPIQNCLSGGFQERVGVVATIPKALYLCGFSGFLFARSTRKVHDGYTNNFKQSPVNGLQLHPVL